MKFFKIFPCHSLERKKKKWGPEINLPFESIFQELLEVSRPESKTHFHPLVCCRIITQVAELPGLRCSFSKKSSSGNSRCTAQTRHPPPGYSGSPVPVKVPVSAGSLQPRVAAEAPARAPGARASGANRTGGHVHQRRGVPAVDTGTHARLCAPQHPRQGHLTHRGARQHQERLQFFSEVGQHQAGQPWALGGGLWASGPGFRQSFHAPGTVWSASLGPPEGTTKDNPHHSPRPRSAQRGEPEKLPDSTVRKGSAGRMTSCT